MANLENPLSLIELAHRAGINDYKLKKLFKHVYGMTVFEYIMMKKVESAKFLILETELPFADIAFQAGFKNVSNFNEAFKRKFDVTPSYMRKHK
jgi:transcriptional regulator GlxA family with amidase domain